MTSPPRIALPEPTSGRPKYNQATWSLYAEAVQRAGGIPVEISLATSQAEMARIAGACSGILLPGSPADVDPEKYGCRPIPACKPKDAAREAADDLLLQDAFNLHKPILGICYGMQSLNVWRNGTLTQDLPRNSGREDGKSIHSPEEMVEQAHPVALVPGSRFLEILENASDLEHTADFQRLSVNSTHHQAVERAGDHLRVVARSPEDGVVEAVEGLDPEQFVLGVQWHPERTYEVSSASRLLFDAFVRAAAAWRPRPIRESVAP